MYMNYFQEQNKIAITKTIKKECEYFIYTNSNEKKILFLKANCFMNLSGGPINYALNQLKMTTDKLIVACDDLETEVGNVKFTTEANPKGHNGIKSINTVLNSNKYPIIRIGISRPTSRDPEVVADYVLKQFSQTEYLKLKEISFIKIDSYINSI